MNKPIFLPGDFFFVDSKKKAPQIVKFFQVAPTIWQWFWRKIRGTNEIVLYYHMGCFSGTNTIIEQQGRVVEKSADKLLNTDNNLLVVRLNSMTPSDNAEFLKIARNDLGEGYDILNIFGKLFTWLTGIKFFARYIQLPNQEICVNRVAYWLKKVKNETFEAKTHSELTTHMIWKYVIDHPEKFTIIYQGIPREENK